MQSITKSKVAKLLVLMLVLLTVVALAGCKGSDGSNGANGTNGIGTNGINGTNGTSGGNTVNFASLNSDEMATIQMTGQITGVTMGANPVVNFTVTDSAGRGVTGLGIKSTSTNTWSDLNYVHVAVARLSTDPTDTTTNSWKNYYTRWDQNNSPTNEGLSAGLVDNGDGSYKYTFQLPMNGATLDLTATTRVAVQISGNVPGTGGSTGVQVIPLGNPVNIIYDFVPNGGTLATRDLVSETACNKCHTRIGNTSLNGMNKTSSTPGHGGRITTQYCVMCHTSQNESDPAAGLVASTATSTQLLVNSKIKDLAGKSRTSTDMISNGTNTYNELEFVTMIHKTHQGENLTLQNYSINAGHYYPNDITYPQDRGNCVTCHIGTDSNKWNTNVTMKACGTCHDNVSWASVVPTGFVQHGGGAVTDDSTCTICHTSDAVKTVHTPVASPDAGSAWNGGGNTHTNAAFIAAAPFGTNLPTGAHLPSYTINSVTVTGVTSTQSRVDVSFTMKLDGTPVTFNTPTSGLSMITGFIGAPTIYVGYAIPQDNAASPVDFNGSMSAYLQNIWQGSAGNLISGGSGSYTAQLISTYSGGAWKVGGAYIPRNATMVTAFISPEYALTSSYSLYAADLASGVAITSGAPPLTQISGLTNISFMGHTIADFTFSNTTGQGGLIVPVQVVYKTATGQTARRKLVDNTKCDNCHAPLSVEPTFHAGNRNNGEMCNLCHNANRVNGGWSLNAPAFIHSIHGDGKRTNNFTYGATSSTDGYFNLTYPAILNDCQRCHVAGGYDYSLVSNANNMLLDTTVTGTLASTATNAFTYAPAAAYGFALDTNYGSAPTTSLVSNGLVYTGGGTNLVNTPMTGACAGCHDSASDIDHMTMTGGGSFYAQRSTVVSSTNVEQCLICHGSGGVVDINTVHSY